MKWWGWVLMIVATVLVVGVAVFWGKEVIHNRALMNGLKDLEILTYKDTLNFGENKLSKVQIRPVVFDRIVKIDGDEYMLFVYRYAGNKTFTKLYVRLGKRLLIDRKIWRRDEMKGLPFDQGDELMLDFAYADKKYPTSKDKILAAVPEETREHLRIGDIPLTYDKVNDKFKQKKLILDGREMYLWFVGKN